MEKAVLLTTVLRELGVAATIVVASDSARWAVGPLWPEELSEAWVVVEASDGTWWLPVDHRGLFRSGAEIGDRIVFPLTAVPGGDLPLAHPVVAALTVATVEVQVDDDGSATAEVGMTWTGGANPYVDLRAAEKDPSESVGDAAAGLLPEGEAGDVVLEAFGADRTSASVQVAGRLEEEAPGMLTLPLVWPGDDPFPPGMHRASRDTPLEFEAPFRRVVRWEVELPDGWEVRLAPPSVRVVTAVGSFVQDVVIGDGVVTVERTLEVVGSRVEPSEYEGFVRIRRSFSTSGSEPIVIAREVAH